ncbi:hypothetical protein C8F01DRAFT_1339333 [Mycena amicta]|nr:hypothetical protein C8F01DRAFT_1339333 [Mycena amicta]
MTRNSELRSQFAEAQARIADLERQLATLRAHETRLKGELGAIVYPILTIPTEITMEILCHAAADSVTQWLLAATSICSLWRNIALSTPRLWSEFLWSEFHSNPAYGKPFKDPASLLQHWLSRSGCVPLYITIPSNRADRRLVTLMAKHILRWRRIDLIGERLYHETLENLPEPSLGLRDATQLVDVDLDACPKWRSLLLLRTQDPGPLLPTVKHITSLILTYVTPAFLSMLLPHTPALEFLSLSGDFSQNVVASWMPPPIVLAHVHTLHYGGRHVLDHISLPALQNLRLTNFLLPPAQEIGPFMTRSACFIQTLCVERLEGMPGPNGLSCLRAISSVSEFTATYRHELSAHDDKHRECMHRISEFLDALAAGNVLASVEQMTLLQIPYCISSALCKALHDKIHLASSRLKKLTIQVNEDDKPPEQWRSVLASKGVEIGVLYYDQDNPPRRTYY